MTDPASTADAVHNNEKTFLGHPRGLVILFLTEMWERFSYYGMRGLLIVYLTQHFLFSDEKSSLIYGAYTALVYVMTIVGRLVGGPLFRRQKGGDLWRHIADSWPLWYDL